MTKRSRLDRGLVQIYTGTGKGKTTAAFGLALRAAGAGLRVAIFQFIKGRPSGECRLLRRLAHVTVVQCGHGCFIRGKPTARDVALARTALARAGAIITRGTTDVVILDEVNTALKAGLVAPADVVTLIRQKPRTVEVVLTGRGCPATLYRYADLVTEMREVKHPYRRGITARRGIEF